MSNYVSVSFYSTNCTFILGTAVNALYILFSMFSVNIHFFFCHKTLIEGLMIIKKSAFYKLMLSLFWDVAMVFGMHRKFNVMCKLNHMEPTYYFVTILYSYVNH
jgi:hypothetical protein